jgi:hypothetical protein
MANASQEPPSLIIVAMIGTLMPNIPLKLKAMASRRTWFQLVKYFVLE